MSSAPARWDEARWDMSSWDDVSHGQPSKYIPKPKIPLHILALLRDYLELKVK